MAPTFMCQCFARMYQKKFLEHLVIYKDCNVSYKNYELIILFSTIAAVVNMNRVYYGITHPLT